jgi:bacterioferritin-associated ferredoxin
MIRSGTREAVVLGPDDEVCICHHVSLRKLVNFGLRERPAHAEQFSECLGAGTGCGWCVPVLRRIAEALVAGDESPVLDVTPEGHAQGRAGHLEARRAARQARPPAD